MQNHLIDDAAVAAMDDQMRFAQEHRSSQVIQPDCPANGAEQALISTIAEALKPAALAEHTPRAPLAVDAAIANAERVLGRPRSADEAAGDDPVATRAAAEKFLHQGDLIDTIALCVARRNALILAEFRQLHAKNVALRAIAVEAVQVIEERARDAFDCMRALDQEAFEAAWHDEVPADYVQWLRLKQGAEA